MKENGAGSRELEGGEGEQEGPPPRGQVGL